MGNVHAAGGHSATQDKPGDATEANLNPREKEKRQNGNYSSWILLFPYLALAILAFDFLCEARKVKRWPNRAVRIVDELAGQTGIINRGWPE